MEIDYDIHREDMIDFNMHMSFTPARRRERMRRTLALSALIAFPGLMLLDSRDPVLFVLGIVLILAAVVTPLMTIVLMPARVRRHLVGYYPQEETSALYGWRRMTIDAQRVLQEGELMVAGWKWPAVERIEVTERLVLFFVARSAALLIPRRAFVDEPAMRQFVEAAERFHRAGRRPA